MEEGQRRLPVRRVGTLDVQDGVIVWDGWGVPTGCDLQEFPMPHRGDHLGGWPVGVLHALTHGEPCVLLVSEGQCPVDEHLRTAEVD